VTFEGLAVGEMLTLFAAFGGGLVVLYILRLRRRRVEVPFSPLWSRVVVEKQSSSLLRRLKRFFSLLVQLAILALLILALGDPKLNGFAGCSYEAPQLAPQRHTLIVVDASASMATFDRGRSRLTLAREAAKTVIKSVESNPNHKVMLVQLDATTRPLTLWSSDTKALLEAVDRIAPDGALDTPTGVDDALRLGGDVLRDLPDAELVFVTDQAFAPIAPERATAAKLRVIGVGEDGDNVGIQAFNVRPYLDDSLTYAIFYAIRNETDRAVNATLFLYANESGQSVADFVDPSRIVASYALELPANGVLEDVVDEIKFDGSRLAAKIVVDPGDATEDIFARDDVAFALVPPRRTLSVQLVTEGNLFLHATLFVRENVEFVTIKPAEYTGPEGFDLTIVDDASVPMDKPGNYFIINPKAGGPLDVTGTVNEPQPVKVKKTHAIARGLTFADLNILRMARVKKVRGDEVVVAAADGAPILMTRVDDEGQRRFVALNFDLRESLLPMNYAFPLLMVNVLSWFYQEADGLVKPNRAGVDVSVDAGALPDTGAGTSPVLRVLGPPGPAALARQVGRRIHMTADRIGIYEVLPESPPLVEDAEAAPMALSIAVNLMSARESQIAPQAAEYAAWTAPEVMVIEDDPWLSKFWRVLLLIALGLVMIEWLTWHRRVTV
jgi:hypothetical protein